jgi:hypothetical protein
VLKLLLQQRTVLQETLQEKGIACIELGPQGTDE